MTSRRITPAATFGSSVETMPDDRVVRGPMKVGPLGWSVCIQYMEITAESKIIGRVLMYGDALHNHADTQSSEVSAR
ncbi:hypothetical protein Hypma_003796 [Hypsizygus marmoreus]|uniref:Uncharacterized protein n=1 Tax=Hypsizygus marmoreus TaxID=39966 RepID=A0A369JZ20_HYPMA|nr:hypothetical protein Hypma_003796 [Hypsizygus marmoreus]